MIFIAIWIITLITLTLLLGEFLYRSSQESIKKKCIHMSNDSVSYTDISLKNLSIESPEFAPSTSLSTRGSWRIAQNKVMSYESFVAIRDEEYSKKL